MNTVFKCVESNLYQSSVSECA